MRLICATTFALLLLASAAVAGQVQVPASRVMAGWFNVTTPEGWVGRRYMDGQDIFAEEFDSNGDGRHDVWRFYRQGMLSSEERDTNANGRVDFQAKWEARDGKLISVLRDTHHRGVNDLEIDATGARTWEIREDRNRDGISDRILFMEAPPDFFEALGLDLATTPNVIDSIPADYWRELWTDDTFTCNITAYYRYSRGNLSQYGEWDGRRIVWRRVPPDFQAELPAAVVSQPAEPAGPIAQPAPQLSEGPVAEAPADPYADGGTAQFLDGAPPVVGSYTPPAPVGGASLRDRTRYEGLPPGDSAARSVPARMRPPGTSRARD